MKSLNKIAMTFILGLFMSSCGEAAKDGQVVLKENNTIVLSDEVNAMTVAKVLEQARDLDSKLKKGEPLYLILNTPGGSVSDGLELVDMLKGMDRKVHTITIFAASMGFQIAQQMNDRLMIGSGTLMSHKARGAVRGEFGGDEPSQLDSRLNLWKSKIKDMDLQTVKRTKGKQTYESYTKAYVPELWLTSSQAIEGGYADKVVSARCDASLKGTKSEMIRFFGLQIELVFSKCPLITGPLDVKMSVKTKRGLVPLNEFVEKGGMFGTACMIQQNSSSYECPVDTSLTMEKIQELKSTAVSKYSQEYMKQNIKTY